METDETLIRIAVLYLGVVLALNTFGLEKLALSILAAGGVTGKLQES